MSSSSPWIFGGPWNFCICLKTFLMFLCRSVSLQLVVRYLLICKILVNPVIPMKNYEINPKHPKLHTCTCLMLIKEKFLWKMLSLLSLSKVEDSLLVFMFPWDLIPILPSSSQLLSATMFLKRSPLIFFGKEAYTKMTTIRKPDSSLWERRNRLTLARLAIITWQWHPIRLASFHKSVWKRYQIAITYIPIKAIERVEVGVVEGIVGGCLFSPKYIVGPYL